MRISWETLWHNIHDCRACGLYATCRGKVMGQGDWHAPLMLIGEAPGEQEDRQGLAFVGPAGQLLTRMLEAITLPRERVYLCNGLKRRPPGNRPPTPEEAAACLKHLRAQVALVRPKVILLLGATAVRAVLGPQERITRCRGQWRDLKGVQVLATYHPSALLRDPAKKPEAWSDLKRLRACLCERELYPDLIREDEA